jgi:hypothetical protein
MDELLIDISSSCNISVTEYLLELFIQKKLPEVTGNITYPGEYEGKK